MKRLLLIPFLVGAVQAETLFFSGEPRWSGVFTENPFPNPVVFDQNHGLAWGDDTSAFTPSNWILGPIPQGGSDQPSYAIFDSRGGPVVVDGPAESAGVLTHFNNPIGDFWDDNNLSTGMNFSPAVAGAEITVEVFSDIGRTDLLTTILLADDIEFTETFNSPGPVDDVFSASIPILDQPFDYNGLQYVATVSLFHPPGDLDSIQTDFVSPENGQSEAHVAIRITSNPIPEPTSYFALGLILGAILALRRYSNGRHRTV